MPTSITEWWNAFVRYRLIAILAFAAILGLTVLVILFAPRVYQSRSRLLLRIGHENATLEPTVTITGEAVAPMHTREDDVETALGVMHSRSIMETVVDRVGVAQILKELPSADDKPRDESPGLLSQLTAPIKSKLASIDPVSERETAIRALESGLSIYAPSRSSVVTIAYQAKHPLVAQNIVAAWVQSYIGQYAKVNRTEGTYPFFAEQDAELKSQLDAAHKTLREAKNRGGFATLLGQQNLLENQLETVRSELLKVDADLVESVARAESVGDLLSTVVELTMTEEVSGIANDARDEMRSLLFQLEVLEQEYAAKFKETHPKLVAIRDQLENARKIVDSQENDRTELRQTANPTHQQLSENRLLAIASQTALQEKKQKLLEQQSDLLEEMARLNEHEEELARLTRNIEVLEERHKLHSVRFEQARLDKVLDEQRISSINVIQPATYEERPVSPDKRLAAMVGMFAAVAVALGLPVLLDLRNPPARESRLAAVARESAERLETGRASSSLQPALSSSARVAESKSSLSSETPLNSPAQPR